MQIFPELPRSCATRVRSHTTCSDCSRRHVWTRKFDLTYREAAHLKPASLASAQQRKPTLQVREDASH